MRGKGNKEHRTEEKGKNVFGRREVKRQGDGGNQRKEKCRKGELGWSWEGIVSEGRWTCNNKEMGRVRRENENLEKKREWKGRK